MSTRRSGQSGSATSPHPGPTERASATDGKQPRAGWHPGVRLVLVLVVLLPAAATALLIGSDAFNRWSYRADAEVVARDATQLQTVALARAQLNDALYPSRAVSFGEGLGLTESVMSKLLAENLAAEIAQSATEITGNATFTSTPALRSDVAAFETQLPKIQDGTSVYLQVEGVSNKFAVDVNDLWYSDFEHMESDAAGWQPPGSFGAHMTALRETYEAFLEGGYEVEGTEYILQGQGGVPPHEEVIQSAGQFADSTAEFAGQLGPQAQAAWDKLQKNPQDQSFQAFISQAVAVAVGGQPSHDVGNPTLASEVGKSGLDYLAGLDALVVGAASDLRISALDQARTASHQLTDEVAFLLFLALVSFGGVLAAGNELTRPLKRLVIAARKIHAGDFDLDQLPESGPREVVTTTSAFNDMASTLKAVEAKTVALSAENLSHPDLQSPLPGRTGQALQAAVDRLANRIRERELQREQLFEEATHDGLTGLLNRVAVFDFLRSDVARRRENGETVAVIFADLDDLKVTNDTYGHVAGDLAIEVMADALRQATGSCDAVGRLGGDEFLVVLCPRHSQDSQAVAEHIRQTVARQSVHVEDTDVFLQCSLGVALTRCDADTDPMDLVRRADEAMYAAKRATRAAQDHLTTWEQRIGL